MKKSVASLWILAMLCTSPGFAYTQESVDAANFIAQKGIINDNTYNIPAYDLDNNITRREMLKVMMNLSGKTVEDVCSWKFQDMQADDWGCKYAEAALDNGYIAANDYFRPDDDVTQIEALKMVMQTQNIPRDDADDWRVGYVTKGYSEGLLDSNSIEYDANAKRGWVFTRAARSYNDFTYTPTETELTPEEEELFNYLLDIE